MIELLHLVLKILIFCFLIIFISRLILGILIQYSNSDGKTITRHLAAERILESSTGVHYAKIVKRTLERFDLNIDQLYAVSTDNGPNMIKAVQVLKLFQSHLIDSLLHDDFDSTTVAPLIDKELVRLESQIESSSLIEGIRCACHCLELAVKEAINYTVESNFVIDEAREIVKTLRTSKYLNLITKRGLKKPYLAGDTRWSSTFIMVSEYIYI